MPVVVHNGQHSFTILQASIGLFVIRVTVRIMTSAYLQFQQNRFCRGGKNATRNGNNGVRCERGKAVCTQARGVVASVVRGGTLWDCDTSFPGASRLAPHEIPQHQQKLFDNDGPEHPDRDRLRLYGPEIDITQGGWRQSLSEKQPHNGVASGQPVPLAVRLVMNELRAPAKPCPVCGVALMRVPTDGSSIVYRCFHCKTEIVKRIRRDPERRPVTSRRGVARFRA